MAMTALLATRDASGLEAFAKQLRTDFNCECLILEDLVSQEAGKPISLAEAMARLQAGEIDLLVANYRQVGRGGRDASSWKEVLDGFDYALVDLIRSAARQPQQMAVIGDPQSYAEVSRMLREGKGRLPEAFRIEQACKALRATGEFDAAVADYLELQGGDAPDVAALGGFPKSLRYVWPRAQALSEGDTPRQKAALYGSFHEHFELLAGPELDYAALIDVSLAVEVIGEFEKPMAALIWRGELLNAAGEAEGASAAVRVLSESERFGGGATLVVNETVDATLAQVATSSGIAQIIAPGFSIEGGIADASLRLMVCREGLGYEALLELRSVAGGVLAQDKNRIPINPFSWRLPSAVQPMVDEWEDMLMAVKLSRHLRSSACVAVKGGRVVARASGLLRQRDAWETLARNALSLEGAALALDEEIEDGAILERAKEVGVAVLIHPGVDAEREADWVVRANELGLALVATGLSLRKT